MNQTQTVKNITKDRWVRIFHWTNVLAMVALGSLGTILLFGKDLGLSDDGKLIIKTIHVLIGYVFVSNLLVRIVRAFIGSEGSRWKSILPGGRNFVRSTFFQLRNLFRAEGHQNDNHSPLGRISVALMLLCMSAMAVTGLTLAGTDVYYPPLGGWIQEWVAADGVDPQTLVPYRPDMVSETRWEEMRAFRSPFKEIHELTFFVLLALVPLHIIGVVLAETKGRGGIVSAMINGRRKGGPPDTE
jgi:Ni/Fe-hydrogenase 1 B-type cytochrome subunit